MQPNAQKRTHNISSEKMTTGCWCLFTSSNSTSNQQTAKQ